MLRPSPQGWAAPAHPCARGISESLHVVYGVSCEGLLPLLPAVSDSALLKRIYAQQFRIKLYKSFYFLLSGKPAQGFNAALAQT